MALFCFSFSSLFGIYGLVCRCGRRWGRWLIVLLADNPSEGRRDVVADSGVEDDGEC